MLKLNSLKGNRELEKFPVSYFNLKNKTMTISVQFEKMPTNDSIEALVIKKLQKLNKKFDWIIAAKTFYKLEKDPKGKGKICRIELSLPGPKIVAFSNCSAALIPSHVDATLIKILSLLTPSFS